MADGRGGCRGSWFDDQEIVKDMTDKGDKAFVEEDPLYCIR